MALVNTYTATPCGPNNGETYEVLTAQATLVPMTHLGAVLTDTNPDSYRCCTINRSIVNQTEEKDVYAVQDSGFALNECTACDAHWS
jgi:hypothetical protein